jgi:hypothetical protein
MLRKEQCPQCAANGKDKSRDNLVVYEDSHAYCFSCGYYKSDRLAKLKPQVDNPIKPILALPQDISIDYPGRCLEWVSSFELTQTDLLTHNALWSESKQRLLFPVFKDEQLVLYSARYFGQDSNAPKWITRKRDVMSLHVINPAANRLVIVEDIISGIKISNLNKRLGSVVLFNSQNPVTRIMSLPDTYNKEYILYLDNDKARDSLAFTREAIAKGLHMRVVRTDHDPKAIKYPDLRGLLC